jgi:hypothetical protein
MPDDPSIPDDARLLRRIIPEWIVADENNNSKRVSSQAFCNSSTGDGTEDGMSVFLEPVLIEEARGTDSVLKGYESNALIAMTAGWVRSWQQWVIRDPLPDESSHAQVMGEKNSNTRRKLARSYEWVRLP